MGSTVKDIAQTMPDKGVYDCWGSYIHDGYLLMPDCTPRVMNWLKNEMQFDEGDVVLSSFPMSGTWWAQEVLWGLLHPDQLGKESTEGVGVRIPFLEHLQYGREPVDVLRDTESPRVYKYHMSARYLAKHLRQGKVKVVVWLMDPRQVMAKYHDMYNWKATRYVNYPTLTWDQFFTLLQKDQLYEGNWFENTKTYLEYENHPNVLLMDYHEAGQDLRGTVKKMAKFLGRPVDEELVDELVTVSRYDPPEDWRSKFTPENERYFNELYKKEMKGTSLENKWCGEN